MNNQTDFRHSNLEPALLGWNQHKSLMFQVQRMISSGFPDSNSKRSVAQLNYGSKIPRLVQSKYYESFCWTTSSGKLRHSLISLFVALVGIMSKISVSIRCIFKIFDIILVNFFLSCSNEYPCSVPAPSLLSSSKFWANNSWKWNLWTNLFKISILLYQLTLMTFSSINWPLYIRLLTPASADSVSCANLN